MGGIWEAPRAGDGAGPICGPGVLPVGHCDGGARAGELHPPALLRFARYLERKEREEALEDFQEQLPGDLDATTGAPMEEASDFGDLSHGSWQRP